MHAAYIDEHVFAGNAALPIDRVGAITPRLAAFPFHHFPLQERLDCSTEHWYDRLPDFVVDFVWFVLTDAY